MSKSPTGKIPYIAISTPNLEAPKILADTALICENLTADGLVHDLKEKLSPALKAHDLAFRALLEDKLYWYQVSKSFLQPTLTNSCNLNQGYERWHENYYTMRDGVMSAIPFPIRFFIGLLAYRGNMRNFYGQGTGRFSSEQISIFKQQIWENVNALLEESKQKRGRKGNVDAPFWVLGGEQPSDSDATLYGFIASGLVCTAAPETGSIIRSHPVIMDYADRIHNHHFQDYEKWEETLEDILLKGVEFWHSSCSTT
jgi:hypothetical protein